MHIVAIVHGGPDGFGVSFPDVPGCIAVGATEQEALENAAEALAFHLEGMQADGDVMPVPRTIDTLRADPEFSDDFAAHVAVALLPLSLPRAAQAAE